MEGRFFTRFHPGTVRRRLLALGYRWGRMRYVPVETVWRRVKGWLLPRRYYGSVGEVRRGVEEALRKLQERLEREVGQSLCMATSVPARKGCPTGQSQSDALMAFLGPPSWRKPRRG
ncbi:hypothetical protein [Thermus tengchongensis]|uniref:hypothetical protein n=1 Tax=Thermus tengchongensis TaxID=1214928 RepID=UPI002279B82D|nr:hypothetical protein [Thermus tengchongensis]